MFWLLLPATVVGEILAPAINGHVVVEGRHAQQRDHLFYDWPGVTVRLGFRVPSDGGVYANIDAASNLVTARLRVDDQIVETWTSLLESGKDRLPLFGAEALKPFAGQLAIVEVLKSSEARAAVIPLMASNDAVKFYGFSFDADEVELLPKEHPLLARDYYIEVLGDADSTGFGVTADPSDRYCFYKWREFTDVSLSYQYVLGEQLGARVHTQAWSAKGVTRNAIPSMIVAKTMSDLWSQALGGVDVPWNFTISRPDLVIVRVGSSDFYSSWGRPSTRHFQRGYRNLLSDILGGYGEARVVIPKKDNPKQPGQAMTFVMRAFGSSQPSPAGSYPEACALPPVRILIVSEENQKDGKGADTAPWTELIHEAMEETRLEFPCSVIEVVEIPKYSDEGDLGCDFHLSAQGYRKLATFLEPHVLSILGQSRQLPTYGV